MEVSVTAATSAAFERMQDILFRPFTLIKWLHLGFIAFLALLGEGGANVSMQAPNYLGGGAPPREIFDKAKQLLQTHLELILIFGTVIFALSLAVGVVIVWVSSRGKLMFVESVIHDRWAVSEPWTRLGALASSLFKFRLLLAAVSLLMSAGALGAAAMLAWGPIEAGEFKLAVLRAAAVLVPWSLFIMLPLLIVSMLLDDFVVPTMYLNNLRTIDAWRRARETVFSGNIVNLLLFYLFKLLLSIAAGVLVTIGTCLTCCLAGLPYISSVAFLPVHAFFRVYSLAFMEQFGIGVFPPPAPVAPQAANFGEWGVR